MPIPVVETDEGMTANTSSEHSNTINSSDELAEDAEDGTALANPDEKDGRVEKRKNENTAKEHSNSDSCDNTQSSVRQVDKDFKSE